MVMQGEAAALEAEVIRAVERLKEEAKEKALKGKHDDDLEYETQISRKKEAVEKSKKEAEEKAKLDAKKGGGKDDKDEKAPKEKESEPDKVDPTGASAF